MRRTLLFLFFLFVALTAYGASTNYDILTGQFLNHDHAPFYSDGTNVGIGSSSPRAKLDVAGDMYVTGYVATDGTSGIGFSTDKAVYIGGNVGIGTTSAAQALHVEGSVYFGAGNVGINTVSPRAKLDVAGDMYVTEYVAANGTSGIGLSTDGSIYAAGNVGIGTTSADQALHVEGAVYTSGNVGIGTANPLSKLSVINPGIVMIPPADETITAGATITANACGGLKKIISGSSVTTSTTNTFTAPATTNTGCCMDVCNIGPLYNITLDANALFVSQGGANVVMTPKDCIRVCSDGTGWIQISPLEAN